MAAVQSGSSCHMILHPDGICLAAKAVAYLPEHRLHSVAYLQLGFPPVALPGKDALVLSPRSKDVTQNCILGFVQRAFHVPPSNPSALLKDLDNRKLAPK